MFDKDTRGVDDILTEWGGAPALDEGNLVKDTAAVYDEATRKLNWVPKTWNSARDTAAAIRAALGAWGGYNEFDTEDVAAAVAKAPGSLTFRFGRESSCVLYVLGPVKELEAFAKVGRKLKADEIDVGHMEMVNHMFTKYDGVPAETPPEGQTILRLWWD